MCTPGPDKFDKGEDHMSLAQSPSFGIERFGRLSSRLELKEITFFSVKVYLCRHVKRIIVL